MGQQADRIAQDLDAVVTVLPTAQALAWHAGGADSMGWHPSLGTPPPSPGEGSVSGPVSRVIPRPVDG